MRIGLYDKTLCSERGGVRRGAAFFAALLTVFVFASAALGKPPQLDELRFTETDRILVLAPHPDDESLATGGVIRHAVKRKIPVLVVLLTNGDGYRKNVELRYKKLNPGPEQFRKLGTARHLESLKAMQTLGLKEKDVVFLSYPDGGTNGLFNTNWDCDTPHLGANGATSAPYPFAYEKNAPYCGENLVKNLEEIIGSFQPTIVFFPDPGDDHHDHWAAGAFAKYVFIKTGFKGKKYTYLVHKGITWPVPWTYMPNHYLAPPKKLVGYDEKWFGFFLSRDEQEMKLKAIHEYASQRSMMEPFLEAFVRKNELFASYSTLAVETSKQMPKFFTEKELPNTVFRDPANDAIVKEFAASGDLTSVAFAYNKEYAWIAAQTRKSISQVAIYGFHLRIFGKNAVSRIDIKIQGGRAYPEKPAKNSVAFDSMIPFETANDRIALQLPGAIFADEVRHFMLSLDVFDNRTMKRIDRTAWRVFELAEIKQNKTAPEQKAPSGSGPR